MRRFVQGFKWVNKKRGKSILKKKKRKKKREIYNRILLLFIIGNKNI